MRVALAQTTIIWENREKNSETADGIVRKAKENGADIVFFPEMSFTGFSMNTGITADDKAVSLERVKKAATENKIAVGFGWVKKPSDKAQNHYTVVSDNGEILSDYVKIHPFSYSDEDKWFESGDRLIVFEYKGYKWATLICYDLRFPELFQAASREAEIIAVPANWPQKRELHWNALLQARAIENQSYVLGINCVGEIGGLLYSGCSSAYDPEGKQLGCIMGKEDILFIDIKDSISEIRRSFPVKSDRKWSLYRDMYGETF